MKRLCALLFAGFLMAGCYPDSTCIDVRIIDPEGDQADIVFGCEAPDT